MEMEDKKTRCPILDVDGVISGGKQFDLDITLPDVHRKKYHFYFFTGIKRSPFGLLKVMFNS